MAGMDVVDLDLDRGEVRRARRRGFLRYGISLTCIVLVAAGVIGSTLYTGSMNRVDVLALSQDLIGAINERVHTEVRAYLNPAQNAVGNLTVTLPDDPFDPQGRAAFEDIARDLLNRHPQIASVYLGRPSGDFLMVLRNDNATIDTKIVRATPDGQQASWVRRDAAGQVVAREEDPEDRYDPRTRSWYRDAAANGGIRWSQLYIFFSEQTPGITASTALRDSDGDLRAVIGADIYLASLSAFLDDQQAQARGTLAIVNGEGAIVAFPQSDQVMIQAADGPRPRTVWELGNPVIAEAFDRLRVEGAHQTIVDIDGERYVFGAASLRGAVARDWWLMLLAPESAYLGFIAVNSRRGLVISSGIVLLSIVLAGLLTYQGIVAERHARTARAGQARIDAQRKIISELADLSGLSDPADEDDIRRAGEILAASEGARRVSFWRLTADGDSLVCMEAFDREAHGHNAGVRLHPEDLAGLYPRIGAGEALSIADGPIDEAAAALRPSYLQAVGTTTLASVPVALGGQVQGAVWIEDADSTDAAIGDGSLARNIANLLAPRMRRLRDNDPSGTDAAETAAPAAAPVRVALPSTDAMRSASLVERRRQMAGPNGGTAGTAIYPGTTALALKLLDDQSLAAAPSGRAGDAVIREVVAGLREEADALGVPYVKIMSDLVIAVDGFDDDMPAAAERLIDVALRLRDRCSAIFLAAGQGPLFAMGMDSGAAYGSPVGFGDGPYNVWGEPVRQAGMLAASAEPGTIQVSETTCGLLQETCIFRRRGAFYLGDVGLMDTFTLRGRL